MGCGRTCGVGSDLGISIVNELEDGAFARSSIYYPAWRPNFASTQIGYSIHNKRLEAVVNVRESALRDPAAACDFYLILKTGNKDGTCKSLDLEEFLFKRLPWEGGFGDMFDLDSLWTHSRSLAHQQYGRYTTV